MRRWRLSETLVEPLGSRAARKGGGALSDQQPSKSGHISYSFVTRHIIDCFLSMAMMLVVFRAAKSVAPTTFAFFFRTEVPE